MRYLFAILAACAGLETALRGLVTHQAGDDWPAVAAAPDTDLAPAIARWHDVLDPIRERALA